MAIVVNEPENEGPAKFALDEDEHDGWGPIRPRRSSMPGPLSPRPRNDNAETIGDPPDERSC